MRSNLDINITNPEMTNPDLLQLTTNIVSAHVSNNNVEITDLLQLIKQVHETLSMMGGGKNFLDRPEPMVSVKKSIFPDHLVSLIDGKKYKMLKRHLKKQGLSPEDYRSRFSLPADYPMVAPNYAQHRSHLAKKIGLGKVDKMKTV